MSNYIKIPFASQGEKALVPDAPTAENLVNFTYGYNQKYETDPKSGGVYIKREPFNGLIYQITEPIQELQMFGIRPLDNDILNGAGYSKGGMCKVLFDPITKRVVKESQNELVYRVAYSMVDANDIDPYADNAFHKEWSLADGASFMEIKHFGLPLSADPTGYILMTASDIDTKVFNFSEYPVINFHLGPLNNGDSYGYFMKVNELTFKALDLRATFMQGFSNGAVEDANRQFGDVQGGGLPNVKYDPPSSKPYANAAIMTQPPSNTAPYKIRNISARFELDGNEYQGYSLDFSTLPSPHNYSDSINRAVQPSNFNASIAVKVNY